MSRTPDYFYREAHRLGYVARSTFKLLQLQKQFKIIHASASVLDLGCAPGAWLQVACQSLGPLERGGAIVGIDLKKVKVPSHHHDSRVRTVCADVMKLLKSQVREMSPQRKGFSIILSDMCPVVIGITARDAAISCELGKKAISLEVSGKELPEDSVDGNNENNVFLDSMDPDASEEGILRRGGNLVIKLFESEVNQEFRNFCKPRFKKVAWSRPKATRSCSREIYLICQDMK